MYTLSECRHHSATCHGDGRRRHVGEKKNSKSKIINIWRPCDVLSSSPAWRRRLFAFINSCPQSTGVSPSEFSCHIFIHAHFGPESVLRLKGLRSKPGNWLARARGQELDHNHLLLQLEQREVPGPSVHSASFTPSLSQTHPFITCALIP